MVAAIAIQKQEKEISEYWYVYYMSVIYWCYMCLKKNNSQVLSESEIIF